MKAPVLILRRADLVAAAACAEWLRIFDGSSRCARRRGAVGASRQRLASRTRRGCASSLAARAGRHDARPR